MKTFDTWAGEPLRCVSFLRRTPQGEYRYRLRFADGTSQEVDVSLLQRTPQGEYRYRLRFADGTSQEVDVNEGVMFDFLHAKSCLDETGEKFDTWAGKPLRCVSFLRRTPQGEYRYRLRFADGTSQEVKGAAGGGLDFIHVKRCLDETGEKIAAVKASHRPSLPEEGREEFPMADGLLDYFPNALAEVARWSKIGNDKHNPGQPMHWNRKKSRDHRNKIARHLIDAGRRDKDGNRHSAALAWRALALLQEELEREEGYPTPRNARD